jgi:hypothetical protein
MKLGLHFMVFGCSAPEVSALSGVGISVFFYGIFWIVLDALADITYTSSVHSGHYSTERQEQ